MTTNFEGVYPILNTPFHDDGTLDLDSQLRLVDYLLEAGAHGLGLFGNASEGYALSGARTVQLLKRDRTAVTGRVPSDRSPATRERMSPSR